MTASSRSRLVETGNLSIADSHARAKSTARRTPRTPGKTDYTALDADISFLTRNGIPFSVLSRTQRSARENGVEAHEELIANNEITERSYYECLAHFLGLTFLNDEALGHIEPNRYGGGLLHSLRHKPQVLSKIRDESQSRLVIAPKRQEIENLRFELSNNPSLSNRFAIAAPSRIREALQARFGSTLRNNASDLLYRTRSSYSAKSVADLKIIAFMAVLLIAILYTFTTASMPFTTLVSVLVAALFFSAISLRAAAAFTLRRNKQFIPELPPLKTQEMPTYSVLVALYNEANVMPELVDALIKLDWPRAKLDIKLVCEADDLETISAVEQAAKAYSFIQLVVVPKGTPKTKPRALNFALPLARGELLVIYDAEDRPHPLQLRAAYHRFITSDKGAACVQAPLLVDNAEGGWLPTLFKLEYASLFDGLLPAFSRWNLPILLGGTSNHFKTSVLRGVGGWDPYNVTEDADLGLRLKRFGHRVLMIDYPTYEEAPEQFVVWLKQRTRWFKGWMQTSIVHLRAPRRMWRQIGIRNFLCFHLISTTLLASALGHPFLIALLAYQLWQGFSGAQLGLAFLLSGNLLFAYGTYALLAYKALAYRGDGKQAWYSILFPLYWILLSVAAWRALFQLFRNPHFWEKTPHGIVRRTNQLSVPAGKISMITDPKVQQ